MLSLWHAWLPRPQGPQTWWRTDGDKNNKHHKQCQQDFSTADHAQVLLITLLTPLGVLWAEGPFGQLLKITSIPSPPPLTEGTYICGMVFKVSPNILNPWVRANHKPRPQRYLFNRHRSPTFYRWGSVRIHWSWLTLGSIGAKEQGQRYGRYGRSKDPLPADLKSWSGFEPVLPSVGMLHGAVCALVSLWGGGGGGEGVVIGLFLPQLFY